MKLKIDENLGHAAKDLLQKAGHDVASVPDQGLCSSPDKNLIEICRREGRCLVTLDLGFANPLVFNPSEYAGIAVLRLRSRPSHGDLTRTLKSLISGLARRDITGKLWIVQQGRVREYIDENDIPGLD